MGRTLAYILKTTLVYTEPFFFLTKKGNLLKLSKLICDDWVQNFQGEVSAANTFLSLIDKPSSQDCTPTSACTFLWFRGHKEIVPYREMSYFLTHCNNPSIISSFRTNVYLYPSHAAFDQYYFILSDSHKGRVEDKKIEYVTYKYLIEVTV